MRCYTAGTVTVTASSPGLTGASVTITCVERGLTSAVNYVRPQSMNANFKEGTYKITGGKFMIPREFRGRENTIAVYDVSGKLLQKILVKATCIPVFINRETAKGIFIVKVDSK
jgi:hypothetical protein